MDMWRVAITTDIGEIYTAFVLAESAADAGVVLGNHVRVLHGFEPGDETGGLIACIGVRRATQDMFVDAFTSDDPLD